MEWDPIHTTIEKVIQTFMGDIVLEKPAGFPWKESNLYMIASSGSLVWTAEKPDPTTLFTRVKLNEDGVTFSAYTLGGHACDLELRTGRLLGFTTLK